MVLVNDVKYACEACIKGHRSSSCKHADRALYEIKPKGRPRSQCEKCRSLRETKRVHGKCFCNDHLTVPEPPIKLTPGGRKARFRNIAPSLPRGLKDLPTDSQSEQVVQTPSFFAGSSSSLSALAQAASLAAAEVSPFASPGLAPAPSSCCSGPAAYHAPALKQGGKKRGGRTSHPPSTPHEISEEMDEASPIATLPVSKALRHAHSFTRPLHTPTHAHSPCAIASKRRPSISLRGPDLPPVVFSPTFGTSTGSPMSVSPGELYLGGTARQESPSFPFPIPPISHLTSIAGTGCTCGFTCACPGCPQHHSSSPSTSLSSIPGSQATSACSDGSCPTCVDNESGIGMELPTGQHSHPSGSSGPGGSGSGDAVLGMSLIDQFFARAAALPMPPEANRTETDMMAFRPANAVGLPKLECCGGRCGCPTGSCGCGEACDGSCSAHQMDAAQSGMGKGTLESASLRRSCCSA